MPRGDMSRMSMPMLATLRVEQRVAYLTLLSIAKGSTDLNTLF